MKEREKKLEIEEKIDKNTQNYWKTSNMFSLLKSNDFYLFIYFYLEKSDGINTNNAQPGFISSCENLIEINQIE